MNIKGILRSTAAKFIAFAGIVGCFAAAVIIGENAIAGCGRDGMIYQFETDFSQSSYMAGQVNNTAVTLEAAWRGGISRQEFEQQTRDFPGSYYGVMNGTVISNAELNDSATQNAAFYLIARPDDATQSNISWYYMPFDDEPIDEYNVRSTTYPLGTVIRVCVTSEQAAQYQGNVERTEENTFTHTIYIVLMLTAAALALFVYLLFVTGRRPEDEEMHLVTLDRLPVEERPAVLERSGTCGRPEYRAHGGNRERFGRPFVPAAAVRSVRGCGVCVCARANAVARAPAQSRQPCPQELVHPRLSLELQQDRRAVHGHVARPRQAAPRLHEGHSRQLQDAERRAALYGLFGRSCLPRGCVRRSGRLVFAFVLGVGWFLAAGYFLIRRIDGFDRIVAALQRMRGGDLSFRLTDMPEGVFAAMAEDLGSLGDGMQAALQNEVRASA